MSPAGGPCWRAFAWLVSERVRNVATIGGVLADADYASDPAALVALGASAVLARGAGGAACRWGLIVDHYDRAIAPDELLLEVVVPPAAGRGGLPQVRSARPGTGRAWGVAIEAAATATWACAWWSEPSPTARSCCPRPARSPWASSSTRRCRARSAGATARPRADRRRARIAAYRRRVLAVEVRRSILGPPRERARRRVTGAIRYAIDVERPGMLHARLGAVAQARITAIDVSAVPADVVLPAAGRRPRPGALRLHHPRRGRPAQRVARHVGEPVAAVAAATERAAGRRPTPSGSTTTSCPASTSPRTRSRTAPRSCTLAGLEHASDLRADAYSVVAATPATASGCCTAAARPGSTRPTSSSRASGRARRAARPDGAARVHGRVDGRAPDRVDRHADAVQRARGARRRVRPRSARRARDRAADGRQLRAEDLCRPGAARRRPRAQGGPAGAGWCSTATRFVTLNRHPGAAPHAARRAARRHLRGAVCGPGGTTGAYADTGPERRRRRAAGRRSARTAPTTSRSTPGSTPTPTGRRFRGYAATQAVWAGEQCVDLLAERLGGDPLELRLQNVLRDGEAFCTGEVLHDSASRSAWRTPPSASAGADRRGKGLCALIRGCRRRAAARPPSSWSTAPSSSARPPPRSARGRASPCPPWPRRRWAWSARRSRWGRSTPTWCRSTRGPRRAGRAHDGPGAGRRRGGLRARIAEQLEAAPGDLVLAEGHASGSACRLGGRAGGLRLAPRRGRLARRRRARPRQRTGRRRSAHWHQGAGPRPRWPVDEETGVGSRSRIAAAVYAGQVADPVRAELQQDGSLVMGSAARFESLDFAGGRRMPTSPTTRPDLARRPAADRRCWSGRARRCTARRRRCRWCPPRSATRSRPRPAAGGYAGARGGGAAPVDATGRRREDRRRARRGGGAGGRRRGAAAGRAAPRGLASVCPTCGIGVCGACTVLVDDEPIFVVPLLLAPLAAGRRLTTLEGLADDPVQAAFERLGAYQCGYCTPGMILTARALLAREPDPRRHGSARRSRATSAAAATTGASSARCGRRPAVGRRADARPQPRAVRPRRLSPRTCCAG